jgi:N4-gp56 family major capsid protein
MATGSAEFVDNTTADIFIPEHWSSLAIVAREQNLVFAKLVDLDYKEGLKYGDTVHVPARSHLSSRSKTLSSNAAITYETITEANTDITIATWEYAAMAVEDIITVQANRDMFSFYAGEMGYALALAIDDVLAGLPDDFSTGVVGTLAVGLTYDDVLRSTQYLDDANAPQNERCIVIAPAEKANFMKMEQFINMDYGSLKGDLPMGSALGHWMGMPVHVSTNVEGSNGAGHDNTMFHRSAMALIVQMTPRTRKMTDVDYLVDKVALEQVSGTKTMRETHGVWMKGL